MGYKEQVDAIAKILAKKTKDSGKGGVYHMTVEHDNDCPKLSGGECKCKPDSYLKEL